MSNENQSKRELMKYAGMGLQFLISIGIGLFIGLKADQWFRVSFPFLVWFLPLLIIFGLIYKFYNDTTKNS
ncbi:hypothetical protein BH20BAC1_BH20BAC1_26210 [soil metagenome]